MPTNVEWLLQEAAGDRSLQVSERTEVDDDHWKALIERLEIGPGLRVFLATADVRKDLTVQPSDGEKDVWLSSDVAVSGQLDIELTDGPRFQVGPTHAVLFRPLVRTVDFHLTAGQQIKLAGYGLHRDRIARLFDDDVPPELRPLLEPDISESKIFTMKCTRQLRQLAQNLFAPGLNGPLRTLFMEGTVLQLLAIQAAGRPHNHTATDLTARERDQVHHARDLLLADMRRPPGLGELAGAVGLTEKRLNTGFRQVFGGTVFETLRNHRLEHARIALETETTPMKVIAYRVGYNHVTNFINAYTARYGVSPARDVRRDGARRASAGRGAAPSAPDSAE
jgi:AraC-like DNA-binding protein